MKHRIILLVFLASILTPLVLTSVRAKVELISKFENKKLVPFPAPPSNWSSLTNWPTKINQFTTSQLPGRRAGIKFYAALRYRMGANIHNRFITGREGWVFQNFEKNFSQYKGQLNFKPKVVSAFADGVAAHQAFFEEEMGTPFIFCMTPDKHFLYSEYFPAYMDRYQGAYTNKKTCEEALKNRGINYLEIPGKMKANKNPDELFFQKLGGHWNTIGAYTAYQEMMQAVAKYFPSLPLLEKEDLTISTKRKVQEYHKFIGAFLPSDRYEWETTWTLPRAQTQVSMIHENEIQAMDSSKMISKFLPELTPAIVETSTKDGPVLLLIRDSMGNQLIPFLEHSFSKIILIHHIFGKWDPLLLKDLEPDIVIMAVSQRNLNKVIHSPDFEKAKATTR